MVQLLLTLLLVFIPICVFANDLNNPGFESGIGTDADNWTEYGNAQRVSSDCRSGSNCLDLPSTTLITVNDPSFENNCPTWSTSWTRSSSSNVTCVTGGYSGTYRARIRSSAYVYQSVLLVDIGNYTFTTYAIRPSGTPSAKLRIASATGAGGTTHCEVSTTSTTWVQISCNYNNPTPNTTVYINLMQIGGSSTYVFFDLITVATPNTMVISDSYSVSSYSIIKASGYVKLSSGSGVINILDQDGNLLCNNTTTTTGSYVYLKTTCSKGSATSTKIKLTGGKWDDMVLENNPISFESSINSITDPYYIFRDEFDDSYLSTQNNQFVKFVSSEAGSESFSESGGVITTSGLTTASNALIGYYPIVINSSKSFRVSHSVKILGASSSADKMVTLGLYSGEPAIGGGANVVNIEEVVIYIYGIGLQVGCRHFGMVQLGLQLQV